MLTPTKKQQPILRVHPFLFALLFLFLFAPSYSQTVLLSGETIQASYKATKKESGKKTDTWQIDVTVQTPAGDTYFEKAKDNPISDFLNSDAKHYLKISVTNRAGAHAKDDKYFSGEKANMVTEVPAMVYEVIGSEHQESFTIDVPPGVIPEVHADVLADLKSAQYFPFVRATPEELSSGATPQSRVFLLYKELDSTLMKRDPIIRYMNARNKPAQASYSNGTFLVRNNLATTDSLSTVLTFVNWDNRKTTARVKGDAFEISLKGSFEDAQLVNELKIIDPDGGEKRMIRLERKKGNVLPLNTPTPVSALPVSDNGTYSLIVPTGGNLQERNNATGQIIWSITNIGSAPSGTMLKIGNGVLTANELFYKKGPNGTAVRGSFLTLGNDGHIRIFRLDGYAMWENMLMSR